MVRVMKSKTYRVVVCYHGYDVGYERELEATVGRRSDGAGLGFGVRDIDWHFKTKAAAEKAVKKLRRFRRYQTSVELNPSGEI